MSFCFFSPHFTFHFQGKQAYIGIVVVRFDLFRIPDFETPRDLPFSYAGNYDLLMLKPHHIPDPMPIDKR